MHTKKGSHLCKMSHWTCLLWLPEKKIIPSALPQKARTQTRINRHTGIHLSIIKTPRHLVGIVIKIQMMPSMSWAQQLFFLGESKRSNLLDLTLTFYLLMSMNSKKSANRCVIWTFPNVCCFLCFVSFILVNCISCSFGWFVDQNIIETNTWIWFFWHFTDV